MQTTIVLQEVRNTVGAPHIIVLPGGGYAEHTEHEGAPVAGWLEQRGLSASVFPYPLQQRHPIPLDALREDIGRRRAAGASRIGLMGFSAGGHLAGLAALAPGGTSQQRVDFAVLGYSITSMETETYRPSRIILLGENATPEQRRSTSLDALVTPASPPFFVWHTAEDPYVPPEHAYLLATSLARSGVPHTVHVFAHGPHSLGLAHGAGEAETWTEMAWRWIHDLRRRSGLPDDSRPAPSKWPTTPAGPPGPGPTLKDGDPPCR